ncbi:hypothetical protein MRS76_03190 [Rhizobiaceae bacterium n13]|uniref:hypothetical protein n=1 Tax=Ferirhizobium litorale TaxID=2927786 RepID=UPI0024B2C803|nr:hypothetical protein [Fererhizobium litorale]MDI7860950.1 hypothetical protein [Fererhizobium litorale]
MNLDEARTIYKKAKDTAGLASPEWVRMHDAKAHRPQLAVRDGGTGTVAVIATLSRNAPYDDEHLLFNAPYYLRAAIMVAEQAFAVIRTQRATIVRLEGKVNAVAEAKDFAANCAMLCTEPAFKKFFEERHGLARPLTDQKVATRIRSILAVGSRSELNTDPAAAERWKALRADYDAWRRA